MVNIELKRMGADFYNEEDKQASDMENFRLRPYYSGSMPGGVSDGYLRDRHGHYIAGDFSFFRPSKGQDGYPEPQLVVDFTDYGPDMKDCKRYLMSEECGAGPLKPTLKNIKDWLELALGEEVNLTLEAEKEDEEL